MASRSSIPTPKFQIAIPGLLSFLSTGSFNGKVLGLNQLQQQEQQQYGKGNYIPPVRAIYWSMRVMAYLGTLVFLVAAIGAWLYRTRRLESKRWFLWTSVVTVAFPFGAALAGWVLTEVGRQPWIVQGLLRTSDANSPSVSTRDDRRQPGRVRRAVRRARHARLRAHAPLCAPRPARAPRASWPPHSRRWATSEWVSRSSGSG